MSLENEQDLPSKQENDHFWIGRIIKFAILLIGVFGLFFLAGTFFYEVWTNPEFKANLLSTIVQELSTIVIAGASILGITFISKQ